MRTMRTWNDSFQKLQNGRFRGRTMYKIIMMVQLLIEVYAMVVRILMDYCPIEILEEEVY